MPIDFNAPLRKKVIPRYTEAAVPPATEWKGLLILVTDANGGKGQYWFSDGTDWLVIATENSAGGIQSFHKIITGTALTNAYAVKPIIIGGSGSDDGKLLDIISLNVWVKSETAAIIANSPTSSSNYIGPNSADHWCDIEFKNGDPIQGGKRIVRNGLIGTGSFNSSFTGWKLYLAAAAASMGFDPADEIHVFGTYMKITKVIA